MSMPDKWNHTNNLHGRLCQDNCVLVNSEYFLALPYITFPYITLSLDESNDAHI